MAKKPASFPERDHGRPDCGEPVGPPRVISASNTPTCPNCGCTGTVMVEVDVKVAAQMNALLAGTKDQLGVATYMGCPACPWASPAMVRRKPC